MNKYIFEPVKPVVETKFGKLRGVTYGDVNIFTGVKYADAKRFQQPVEQQPWEGVKNAYFHGPVSPLARPASPFALYRGLLLLQTHGEDCLNLNIWAPNSSGKKPVFVWMHGGGYAAGNALEEYSFDGFNLAHYGGIVFVSINHRLNLVAHMNLADYGEKYKNSVNAGIADLVAALKWIHENIAAFGGDPENVTICGHSGGGGKVQCMYQIEEAKDYFQRGMVLSGAMGGGGRGDQQAATRASAKAIMDELGITKDNVEKIDELPLQAFYDASAEVAKRNGAAGMRMGGMGWSPVKDDLYFGNPLDVGFAPWSKEKPFVIGSVLGEFPRVNLTEDEKLALTDEGKMDYLRKIYGENTDELIRLFKAAYPTHDFFDVAYADTMVRTASLKTALLRSQNGLDNTRIFIGAYNSVEYGSIPIWHGGEVGYMFMNEDRVWILNEPVYGEKYGNIFSSIALNYCKNGDPSNQYLPEWKPITEDHHYTMVIDRECELKEGYDEAFTDFCAKIAPPFHF